MPPIAKAAPTLKLTDCSGCNCRPPFSIATGLVGGNVSDSVNWPSTNTVAARRRLLWPMDGALNPVLTAARSANESASSSRLASLPFVVAPKSLNCSWRSAPESSHRSVASTSRST